MQQDFELKERNGEASNHVVEVSDSGSGEEKSSNEINVEIAKKEEGVNTDQQTAEGAPDAAAEVKHMSHWKGESISFLVCTYLNS